MHVSTEVWHLVFLHPRVWHLVYVHGERLIKYFKISLGVRTVGTYLPTYLPTKSVFNYTLIRLYNISLYMSRTSIRTASCIQHLGYIHAASLEVGRYLRYIDRYPTLPLSLLGHSISLLLDSR